MKKLIKLAILIVVLAVFAFSSNSHIVKARKFVAEKGKVLYEKGVEKLQNSENENLAKAGKIIE